MSLDIVSLIEKNPVSKLSEGYQSKLLNKICKSFTGNEQHVFIASFYCYLNCDPNDFVIDLDNIYEWMGFSNKSNAKRVLVKNFVQDKDYVVKMVLLQVDENSKGGRPSCFSLISKEFTLKDLLCLLNKRSSGKTKHVSRYCVLDRKEPSLKAQWIIPI